MSLHYDCWRNFKKNEIVSVTDWHKAAQGLFAGGILFLLVAVSIATFHFCCCCCKGSFSIHSALGSMALAASKWSWFLIMIIIASYLENGQ